MTNSLSRRPLWAALVTGLGLALQAQTVTAHPHAYVNVETTVLYDKGVITGLQQRWAFDEFYTGMAVEGLDANGDGTLNRSELAELAKVNIDGLAQVNYFTTVRLGGQPLTFGTPKDFWFDHVAMANPPGRLPLGDDTDAATAPAAAPQPGFWSRLVDGLTGSAAATPPAATKVLVLQFSLPLQQPVIAEAEGFEYSVSDPTFYIAFDLASPRGAELGPAAPVGCKAVIGSPKGDLADLQKLGESVFQQAGGVQFGLSVAKTVSVSCPKQ